MAVNVPATGYRFNSMQEIKSHSSILFNERMAILFYLIDMESINLNTYQGITSMLKVKALLKQVYKNIRTLIRNNPTMRATLNLNSKDSGIYITDIMLAVIDKMLEYCENYKFTPKRMHIIINELNNFEVLIKDILQYYHYFIRPDFRQKPDIEIATERYKELADMKSISELKELVGKRHSIDFEGLGSSRIELQQNQPEIEPNEQIEDSDDNISDEETEDSDDKESEESEENNIIK